MVWTIDAPVSLMVVVICALVAEAVSMQTWQYQQETYAHIAMTQTQLKHQFQVNTVAACIKSTT